MHPTLKRSLLFLAFLATTIVGLPAFADPALTPKPNDLWVMAGDSITAQRLHTNYIEAFYRTRYPGLNLSFRNSGIGGNRVGNILARFDYNVAAWKPTIVSIELGMNDVNDGEEPVKYIKGMQELIQRIRDLKAEPVLISSSPVNDGSLPGNWKSDRCRKIDPYTNALKKLAEEEGVVFVDQYHPLLELWGQNHAKGDAEAAAHPADKTLAKKYSTGFISLHGDAVHSGPDGQYTMAATILEALHVDHDVSSATIKADGTVVDAKRCKLSDISSKEGKLSFIRLDECSPWPIDPKAKAVIGLLPSITDLSRYMLTIPDLAPGNYAVSIDGKPAATLSEKDLAAGWNISTVFEGAIADRSSHIIGLIANLQGKLNNDWRAASKEKSAEKLAAAQKAIDDAESEVRAACQPVAWKFEVQKGN